MEQRRWKEEAETLRKSLEEEKDRIRGRMDERDKE